jgi:two-component system NarL family sensor kinase
MSQDSPLAEWYLRQCPGCHWITGADGRIVQMHGSPTALFGQRAEDLQGRDLDEAMGAQQAGLWRGRVARVFKGEMLQLRERRGDATWSVWLFPLRQDGEVYYAGGTAREATAWRAAEDELRHTVLGALKAQERERSKVSRYLHDSVGQTLTAVGLRLDLIRMDLEVVSPDTCRRIAELQDIIGEIMESVREYSYELNPSTVERAGLRPAVDRLLGRIRARYAGTVRANVDPSLKLDPPAANAFYHIAEEAVENAVQHASCSSIEISVKSTRTGTILEVRDNGRGFDPADILAGHRGLGLLSMEHYAAEAGLELSIASMLEAGTTVRATATGPAER